jgi:V8-like Glu-specific endopeptidase
MKITQIQNIKTLIIIALSFVLYSCEDKNACGPEFLTKLNTIKQEYKTLYNENSTESEKQILVKSLEGFLNSHKSVSCTEGTIVHNPTKEISHLLSDLKNEEREIFSSKAFVAKVIYGEDDRIEVNQSTNELFKTLAKSTAAMIKNSKISADLKLSTTTLGDSFNLCEGERFRDQINPASCSGFLVSKDVMVTAGHCLKNQFDCDNSKWVFDFDTNNSQLKIDQIFTCTSIIERKLVSNGADYAVFKIDREVIDRKPLKFRTKGVVAKNQKIVVIGHPSGLPTKIAAGAVVRDQTKPDFFLTNLDTFGGNSGSAVFNVDTGFVEGILVRGETDYITVFENGTSCRKVNECKSDECRGEDVTKITSVLGLPKPELLSAEKILKGIKEASLDKTLMGGALSYFGVEHEGFVLGGRNFLGQCGVQVSSKEDLGTWVAEAFVDCSNDGDLQAVYNKFKDLAN